MVSLTPTITAPITFAQYAKTLPEASMNRIVVDNMAKTSDLLSAISILPASMGKREFTDTATLPTVSHRNFNAAGTQGGGTFNLRTEDTFPMDHYVPVDRAIIDRLSVSEKYKQIDLATIALAQYATSTIINGDNSATVKQPNGLKVRCNTVDKNLKHNSASSGGAALSLANLDILYRMVNRPTHWLFPRNLMAYVDIAARSSTLTGQTFSIDSSKDEFGRAITKYKGLPILFGYEPDDSPDMIPFTEVASGGGSAVTASIYCVSLRPNGFYLIEQTALNVEDEGMVAGVPQTTTHIKWDWGLALEHPYAAARLTSITATTIVA